MPRRLDEKMVVDAKGELIDIANKKYHKWKPEDKAFAQRDFVLRLEHFKELRRYSERKGTRLTEDDLKFDQDLLAKAVASGMFDSVEELAEKVARGEEETHRLGRTLETEKKVEKKKKESYGYKGVGKSYDIVAARKMYREQGMTEKEIDDKVKADILKLDGYEVCTVCKKVIDAKHGTAIITEGKCYCVDCHKGKQMIGKPYEINGVLIKCNDCGVQIKVGWSLWYECPEGESMNEKCKWYCRKCWFRMPEHQEQKARFLKKLNGRKPMPEV